MNEKKRNIHCVKRYCSFTKFNNDIISFLIMRDTASKVRDV